MDLSRRSEQKELLDREDIPFAAIERNMRELDTINTWLGGHAITLAGFRKLLENQMPPEQVGAKCEGTEKSIANLTGFGDNIPVPLVVAEIGCGGGDNLLAIRRYCRQHNREVRFIGIDWNPHCIAVAAKKFSDTEARWITADYRQVDFSDRLRGSSSGQDSPHIIFSSLFCHHFGEDSLVEQLRWMQEQSSIGFFINDLHRHFLAYQSIRLLVSVFSRSYLVKNDAPLSVLRGFRRAEWEAVLHRAGIRHYTLAWKWAFRWLLVVAR